MAAISASDCTITVLGVSGFKVLKIVTPATADDGDTIDLSDYFSNGCMSIAVGATDGAAVGTATSYSTTVTLPGSTDNEARTILAFGN